MLRSATVVLTILLVLGSSGLSASAFARGGDYGRGVMVFAAISLAAASVLLPVTATAVTVTAPVVCMADSASTAAATCGATGVGRPRQLRVAALPTSVPLLARVARL
jgi:hypothetical protein